MSPYRLAALFVSLLSCLATTAGAYTYCGGWFGDNVVMDVDVKPLDVFGLPAQYQLAEWNSIQGDTSRPFRVLTTPVDQLGSGDGYNTVGFLTAAHLLERFGIVFDDAVAVTFSRHPVGDCTQFSESDVVFDAEQSWNLSPADEYWFQSTAIHEFGHILGFDHYNTWLSVMNSGVNKLLRGETLYMDDREGFRNYYSSYYALPEETDITIYPKYHDGSEPAWMTLSSEEAFPGETITLENMSVENLGTTAFGPLRAGFYLSTNQTITTSDRFLGWVGWSSFGRFTHSVFSFDAVIPLDTPPGTYYIGAILDDDERYAESDESNNSIVAVDDSPDAVAIVVLAPRTTTTTTPSTTTSTTICSCPAGTHCSGLECKPDIIPVPKRRCKKACGAQVRTCRTTCTGPRLGACKRRCKPRIVGLCRSLGGCPLGGF